jgi:hypothetical protein
MTLTVDGWLLGKRQVGSFHARHPVYPHADLSTSTMKTSQSGS